MSAWMYSCVASVPGSDSNDGGSESRAAASLAPSSSRVVPGRSIGTNDAPLDMEWRGARAMAQSSGTESEGQARETRSGAAADEECRGRCGESTATMKRVASEVADEQRRVTSGSWLLSTRPDSCRLWLRQCSTPLSPLRSCMRVAPCVATCAGVWAGASGAQGESGTAAAASKVRSAAKARATRRRWRRSPGACSAWRRRSEQHSEHATRSRRARRATQQGRD